MNRARAASTEAPLARNANAPASRQQARTLATRRRLLAAAEKAFARDGFEAARLEDIAHLAGYTRGAFYANFRSKEDIFFALLEDWVSERISEVTALLARHDSPASRVRALRGHYAQLAKDRRLVLLSLEFKLYAIRHTEAHARLRVRQRRIRASVGNLLRRLAQASGHELSVASTAAAAALGAVSNALLLENLVDSATINDQDIRYLLGVFFDAILGAKSAK
ncbi:MAG TPA: TetR family transcriptional regulator [Candidatus Acidoferrum sp.]|nr:TetR family transcriptional regulator [Candidatus Acidoferrum sp.]